MKTLAFTILLALPSVAHACTGTALHNVDGTSDYTGVRVGQEIGALTNLDRAVCGKDGSMTVCGGDTCYPAIGIDNGSVNEIIELHQCKIGNRLSSDNGNETFEIIDTAPEKPAEAEPSSFDDTKRLTANDCPMTPKAPV